MKTTLHTARTNKGNAIHVTIEVSVTDGIGIYLKGLTGATLRESLLRVATALSSQGFRLPGKRIDISVFPEDARQGAPEYDLPMALGIAAASGQCKPAGLDECIIAGELGLDGSVRCIEGGDSIGKLTAAEGMRRCILPKGNTDNPELIDLIETSGVETLYQATEILSIRQELKNNS